MGTTRFEIIAGKFEKYKNTSLIPNLPNKLVMFKILLKNVADGSYWELQLYHNYFEVIDASNQNQVLTEICSKLIRVGMDGLYSMRPVLYNNYPAHVDLPECIDCDLICEHFQVYPFGLNNSKRTIAYGSINIPQHLWKPIIDIQALTAQGVPVHYERKKGVTIIPGEITRHSNEFVFRTPDNTIRYDSTANQYFGQPQGYYLSGQQ